MEHRTKTIDLKGKSYAQVKDRLAEFRTANPNGLIETHPVIQADGQILFKARIVKDKGDVNSAEATGHALGANKGEKAFEKLETIAVGRALSLLGYASDGEIASSDEMEEFLEYQAEKEVAVISEWETKLGKVKTIDALKKVWGDMPVAAKTILNTKKEELKAILITEAHANA